MRSTFLFRMVGLTAAVLFLLPFETLTADEQDFTRPEGPMKTWTRGEFESYMAQLEARRVLAKTAAHADRKFNEHDGNKIRTLFYNYGSIGRPNTEPSMEWPAYSNLGYAYEFGAMVGAGGPQAELGDHRTTHGPTESLFEDLLQFAIGILLDVAAAHRIDAVEILRHLRPILVEGFFGAGLRGADDVASRQRKKLAGGGQIADFHLKTPRRIRNVDIPIVHVAVNLNVAQRRARRGGGRFPGNLAKP